MVVSGEYKRPYCLMYLRALRSYSVTSRANTRRSASTAGVTKSWMYLIDGGRPLHGAGGGGGNKLAVGG